MSKPKKEKISNPLTQKEIDVLRKLINRFEAQEETKIVPELTPKEKRVKKWEKILNSGKRVTKKDILGM
ncbi:hypothetical protein [uncultured Dokdonia sp.]|uniref:hypothetical protein n=1 Tax=uncultured Dokdonia sp. TaxID=575653 RepID=UPI0026217C49|nr:hypothetical protein [uncultured Dokdonia sp.]